MVCVNLLHLLSRAVIQISAFIPIGINSAVAKRVAEECCHSSGGNVIMPCKLATVNYCVAKYVGFVGEFAVYRLNKAIVELRVNCLKCGINCFLRQAIGFFPAVALLPKQVEVVTGGGFFGVADVGVGAVKRADVVGSGFDLFWAQRNVSIGRTSPAAFVLCKNYAVVVVAFKRLCENLFCFFRQLIGLFSPFFNQILLLLSYFIKRFVFINLLAWSIGIFFSPLQCTF